MIVGHSLARRQVVLRGAVQAIQHHQQIRPWLFAHPSGYATHELCHRGANARLPAPSWRPKPNCSVSAAFPPCTHNLGECHLSKSHTTGQPSCDQGSKPASPDVHVSVGQRTCPAMTVFSRSSLCLTGSSSYSLAAHSTRSRPCKRATAARRASLGQHPAFQFCR